MLIKKTHLHCIRGINVHVFLYIILYRVGHGLVQCIFLRNSHVDIMREAYKSKQQVTKSAYLYSKSYKSFKKMYFTSSEHVLPRYAPDRAE